MDTYTLLLQINKKLDTLLRMHGINSDQDNVLVGKATYSDENKELFKKYEVRHE